MSDRSTPSLPQWFRFCWYQLQNTSPSSTPRSAFNLIVRVKTDYSAHNCNEYIWKRHSEMRVWKHSIKYVLLKHGLWEEKLSENRKIKNRIIVNNFFPTGLLKAYKNLYLAGYWDDNLFDNSKSNFSSWILFLLEQNWKVKT